MLNHKTDCLVIGSGAGGMTTALYLARAGMSVIVVEEGDVKSGAVPFSLKELRDDYRSGGQILTLGRGAVNLGEGKVLGGGTAVNTGYYMRADTEKLESMIGVWKIRDLSVEILAKSFLKIEEEIQPRSIPQAHWMTEERWLDASQACSLKVTQAQFTHRWDAKAKVLVRNSVYDLWKRELISLGVQFISQCQVTHFQNKGSDWKIFAKTMNRQNFIADCKHLFLCAGALQTPYLLRKSGITENIGNNLQFHLFLRVLARFKEPVNPDRCPLLSWKSSNNLFTLGHSPDYPHLMALAFPDLKNELIEQWPHWSSFYACTPTLTGRKVRGPIFAQQAVVFSQMSSQEKSNLSDSEEGLKLFLNKLGATQVYPTQISKPFLQSVHLYGSCPAGEDLRRCVTDSWGRVHGHKNLYINDASLLGSSIGQNPQATVMALAHRNVMHFLSYSTSQ